jgi:hydrophobe/amphiphile efflux-1 (HAE1) family protein
MSLTDVCIRRPILAWMLMAATVVFGAVALTRVGISEFPDVDHPIISVALSWEGAAPEAMETDVVEIVEESLSQVEGVKTIASSSRQGTASVTVELHLSRDVDLAMQDVQARVAQVQRRLPRDMDPPVVSKTNPEDQPIMWVGLSGPFAPQTLADTARYAVKEKLQTIPGVGEVIMGGLPERALRIWVNSSRLDEWNLTVKDVIAALQRGHVELPAGRIDARGREINVRILGEALDLGTLRALTVAERDGYPVRLEDVALVEDGFQEVRRLSRVNGNPAQGLGIKKQRGANAVAVALAVREVMAQVRPGLPKGMEIGINFDSTVFVEEAVEELQFEVLLAIVLTALVCWMFLGSISATLNVILAIPMSLMGTIAVIYFLGFTLNTFTLLALALAVGIVVDDAIMVMENIHRHHAMGKGPDESASDGTGEIRFAALAATVAVVAIFIPVVFMEGVIGRFFLEFGITFCVAVMLSYLEAITLAPSRTAQVFRKMAAERSRRAQQGGDHEHRDSLTERVFAGLANVYGKALRFALRRPLRVLAGAFGLLVAAFFVFQKIPSEFAPSQDQGRLMINLRTAVGTDLEETDRAVRRAEAFLNARPEVARSYVVIGSFRDGAVNSATLFVTLVPRGQRMSAGEFANVIRKEVSTYPGLRAIIQDQANRGFGGGRRSFPVELSVRGHDWDELVRQSRLLVDKLEATGTVVDLDTDYQVGMPELRISPDRARASDLGVPIDDIATTINALVGGVRAGKFSSGGRRIDVRLQLLADQRARPQDVSRLRVRAADGTLVPLSTLVVQEERPTLQEITRIDRERAISIFGNVAKGSSQADALAAAASLAAELPAGYRAVAGGSSVTFETSMRGLWFALGLGILVAYMVLASQFNSLVHPVTVLTILPLSMAGAVAALYVSGFTLNVFSMIGLLLLMGIVKKNSIILVDYANQLRDGARESGAIADAREAMTRAGPVRLRPILMTSAATMMAAVPSALGLGPGAEIRMPMAVAVIGGVLVATALSLFVVPAFYCVVARRARPHVKASAAPDTQDMSPSS